MAAVLLVPFAVFFGKDGDKKMSVFFFFKQKTGFTEIKDMKDADQWKRSCASHMTSSADGRSLDGLKSLREQLGIVVCRSFFLVHISLKSLSLCLPVNPCSGGIKFTCLPFVFIFNENFKFQFCLSSF